MLYLIILSIIGGVLGCGTTLAAIKVFENNTVSELEFVREENILDELAKENINKKKEKCIVCNKRIRKDNIGQVITRDNNDYFVCKNSDCLVVGDDAVSRKM